MGSWAQQGSLRDAEDQRKRERHCITPANGIGMAGEHALLGFFGDDALSDKPAIGSVVNVASRLCGHATKPRPVGAWFVTCLQ